MRYLVDTHALLWFVAGDPQMSNTARTLIEDPNHEMFVSAATAWEIATKFRLGKLPGAGLLATNFVDAVTGLGFSPLSITAVSAQRAGGWPGTHKDPFDRVLAAQVALDEMTLITADGAFAQFGIPTTW